MKKLRLFLKGFISSRVFRQEACIWIASTLFVSASLFFCFYVGESKEYVLNQNVYVFSRIILVFLFLSVVIIMLHFSENLGYLILLRACLAILIFQLPFKIYYSNSGTQNPDTSPGDFFAIIIALLFLLMLFVIVVPAALRRISLLGKIIGIVGAVSIVYTLLVFSTELVVKSPAYYETADAYYLILLILVPANVLLRQLVHCFIFLAASTGTRCLKRCFTEELATRR
jgi:hypothetical protein